MKTVKFIIFIIGIFLVNYVGGIPHDGRNLFITHTVFFAPILVDFYRLLAIKSMLKILIGCIWLAGIFAMVANILGVIGVLTISGVPDENLYKVSINKDYSSFINWSVPVDSYLLGICIVYLTVFMGTLTLNYALDWDKKLVEKRKQKQGKVSGKGLASHVTSR